MRNWIAQRSLSEGEGMELAQYGEFLSHLLFYQGLKNAAEAEKFLNPSYERDLHDPFLILNMRKAVDRILAAISRGEKIVIFGDYDCDGIPGSVILHDFFKKISFSNFSVYIPHRHLEGYGLNVSAIEKFAEDGVKLIITVDSGITNVKEVSRANDLGIDVIITDHHLAQEEIPNAYAILNSKQADDKYPFNMLCGASVALKLVHALLHDNREKWNILVGWEKWLLDMAGISTIADMVPLHGENRVLAYFGLKVLQRSSRPGLQKLLTRAHVDQRMLNEDDIGFTIGPRVNAASRMGVPMHAFKLLSSIDAAESGVVADYLERKNNERKRAVTAMMKEIDRIMAEENDHSVVVVGHKDWAPGVVGLAAGKIADKYRKPAFVWGREGANENKGSCRSDGLVNMVELMTMAGGEELFSKMGGHALAGGFSVSDDNLEKMQQKLNEAYLELRRSHVDVSEDEVVANKKISLDDVTLENCRLIQKMAPFGTGNKRPLFLLECLEISDINFFGSIKNHLKLYFKNSWGDIIVAILFNYKDKIEGDFLHGDHIDMLAHMEIDNFGYEPRVRLRIVEIRVAS